MQAIFDEGLVFSFQEVVKQAVLEIMDGNGMPAFQQALRSGLKIMYPTFRTLEPHENSFCPAGIC